MYSEFFINSFKQNFIYRANTVIRLFTAFVYLFVTVNIWQALYRGKAEVDGVTIAEMLTYVLIVQVLHCFERLDVSTYFADRIVNGNISIDFIRPVNLKLASIASCAGEVAFTILVFVLPLVVMGGFVWGIRLPSEPWQWAAFFISGLLGAAIYAMIEYLMGVSVFWFKTGFHIQWTMGALFTLFSGGTVPLWFYPAWLKGLAEALPFRFVIFEPANIFVGKASPAYAASVIAVQLVWLVALNVVGYVMWRFAQRVVTVQGG